MIQRLTPKDAEWLLEVTNFTIGLYPKGYVASRAEWRWLTGMGDWAKREKDIRNVYIIQSGGPCDPVKIGVATRVERRLSMLQSGNPVPLRVLLVIGGGGRALEDMLHRRFSGSRLRGEWFSFTSDIATFIEDVKRGCEKIPEAA